MSVDPGYMLIRVDLQGARQAAAEAQVLSGSIAETGAASAAASAASVPATSRAARGWSALGKAVKYGALGIAAGIGALAIVTKKAIADVTELGLVAAGLRRNLDLTAEAGSRWAAIAKARDIAPTSLNMAFKTLNTTIDNANHGGDEQRKTLQRLGMTNKQIEKSQTDFNFATTKTAELFGEMEGGAKRNALSAKLLGRGYQTVLPLFSQGSKGLKEYLGWADKYNVTMGDKAVDATVDLKNAQRESKVAWMGIQNVLAQKYIPSLIDANEKFQALAEVLTDDKLTKDEKLTIVAGLIKTGFETAFDWIIDTAIPELAEHVGQTAPKIAVGFAKGFMNANVLGKIAIGYWLISKLVGGKLLSKIALAGITAAGSWLTSFVATIGTALVGTRVGLSLYMFFGPGGTFRTKMGPVFTKAGGWAARMFLAGLVTLGLVALLENDETRNAMERWGRQLGEWIVNGIIWVVNQGIDLINNTLIAALDALPVISVGDIGPIGNVDFTGTLTESGQLSLIQGGQIGSGKGGNKGTVVPGTGGNVIDQTGGGGKKDGKGKKISQEAMNRDITIHSHTYLDGKQVAESVEHHVMREAARR